MLLFLLQVAQQSPSSASSSLTDPITIATIVIAVCTVFYSVFTYFLLRATSQNTRITSEVFEASHRPYLGVVEITTIIAPEKKGMQFNAPVTNTGTVPATNVDITTEVIIDGIPVKLGAYENNVACVMPNTAIANFARVGGESYERASKASSITLRFSIKYQGIAQKQYQYDVECVYYTRDNLLITTAAKST